MTLCTSLSHDYLARPDSLTLTDIRRVLSRRFLPFRKLFALRRFRSSAISFAASSSSVQADLTLRRHDQCPASIVRGAFFGFRSRGISRSSRFFSLSSSSSLLALARSTLHPLTDGSQSSTRDLPASKQGLEGTRRNCYGCPLSRQCERSQLR